MSEEAAALGRRNYDREGVISVVLEELRQLALDMRAISNTVTRHTVLLEHLQLTWERHLADDARTLERFEARLQHVEDAQARMEGALNLVKWGVPILTPILTAGAVLLARTLWP